MGTGHFRWGVVDDDEDVVYPVPIPIDHLVESAVNALQLVEGDVLLGSRLRVGQICYDIHSLIIKQYVFGNLVEVSTQHCPLPPTELIELVSRLDPPCGLPLP